MKKRSTILSLLLLAAMILAACGGSGQDTTATEGTGLATSVAGTQDSGLGAVTTPLATDDAAMETEAPLGAATEGVGTQGVATEAVGTPSSATEGAGTAMATPAGTGLSGTATVSKTEAVSGTAMTTPAATDASSTEAVSGTGTPSTSELSGTPQATEALLGAEIVPADARRFMILLSNWQGFDLVDSSGQVFGPVNDYIVNLCEAHVLYMMVESSESGSELLIPFEAVTVNGGSIDAESATIAVNLDANVLSGAPTLEARPDLAVTDWEADVRSYWGGVTQLSSLDTGCNVSATATQVAPDGSNLEGTTVTKLVYASELQGASLQDGNGTVLGQVRDAVVEPESGQIFYLAIGLDGVPGQGAVLVPVGAVNVADSAAAGDTEGESSPVVLVLLVDTSVLQNAPAIISLGALTTNIDEATHQYWSQYVPLGPGPSSTTAPSTP